MTMMNRTIRCASLIIAGMVLIAACSSAIAHAAVVSENEVQANENSNVIVEQDYVTIEDEDGNPITVEVTEVTEIPQNGIMPNATTPALGTTKTYTVKVTNEQMGLPGIVSGGLGLAAKTKAANITKKAIAAKLGSKFIPGLNLASWLLSTVAFANAINGKAGIKVTCTMKYKRTWVEKEGYYVYGWGPTSASVKAY